MPSETIEAGYCECGCGAWAGFWESSHRSRGRVKGQPKRFVQGHRPLPTLPERILSYTDLSGNPDDCWEWLGAKVQGYGSLKAGGRGRWAYRVVYEYLVGPVPEGQVLDHLCRNTACVNPAHLEPVLTGENTRRGDAAKLNWRAVAEIRESVASGEPYVAIAPRMGVHPNTVGKVARGESWPESQRPKDVTL